MATTSPIRLSASTTKSAVLDWDSRDQASGRQRLALVRDLLTIRREKIMPRLAGAVFGEAHAADNGLLTAHWRMGDGAMLRLDANLSNDEIRRAGNRTDGHCRSGAARSPA